MKVRVSLDQESNYLNKELTIYVFSMSVVLEGQNYQEQSQITTNNNEDEASDLEFSLLREYENRKLEEKLENSRLNYREVELIQKQIKKKEKESKILREFKLSLVQKKMPSLIRRLVLTTFILLLMMLLILASDLIFKSSQYQDLKRSVISKNFFLIFYLSNKYSNFFLQMQNVYVNYNISSELIHLSLFSKKLDLSSKYYFSLFNDSYYNRERLRYLKLENLDIPVQISSSDEKESKVKLFLNRSYEHYRGMLKRDSQKLSKNYESLVRVHLDTLHLNKSSPIFTSSLPFYRISRASHEFSRALSYPVALQLLSTAGSLLSNKNISSFLEAGPDPVVQGARLRQSMTQRDLYMLQRNSLHNILAFSTGLSSSILEFNISKVYYKDYVFKTICVMGVGFITISFTIIVASILLINRANQRVMGSLRLVSRSKIEQMVAVYQDFKTHDLLYFANSSDHTQFKTILDDYEAGRRRGKEEESLKKSIGKLSPNSERISNTFKSPDFGLHIDTKNMNSGFQNLNQSSKWIIDSGGDAENYSESGLLSEIHMIPSERQKLNVRNNLW